MISALEFPPPPTTAETAVLGDTQQIMLGMLWILQAITIKEYQTGNLNTASLAHSLNDLLNKYQPRLEEIEQELRAAQAIQTMVLGRTIHHSDGSIEHLYEPQIETSNFFQGIYLTYLGELAEETLTGVEKIKNMEIVMVAGHQGAGKGIVTAGLAKQGYFVLSMSEIVKSVASAWALNQNQTADKIVTGQIFKEYFGPEILVWLGLLQAAEAGHTKVVIDGPRVIEEAQAVQKLGGKLLGVINHLDSETDRQLRRNRIIQRAKQDPARTQDVGNFDHREAQESARITSILALIESSHIIINTPQTSPTDIQTLVASLVI